MTKDEFLSLLAEALDVQELSSNQELLEIDSLSILNLIDLYELHGITVTASTLGDVQNVNQLLDLAGKAVDAS